MPNATIICNHCQFPIDSSISINLDGKRNHFICNVVTKLDRVSDKKKQEEWIEKHKNMIQKLLNCYGVRQLRETTV